MVPSVSVAALSALLLVSATAAAEPKVGDRATYNETITKDGKTVVATNVVELVRFDDENHRYLERDTKRITGQPDQVEETWKETAEMLTDEKVASILADCDGAGGSGTLVWVPAGIYPACEMPVKADDMQPLTGKVWIARVPFGLAHAELNGPDGDSVINLRSYDRP
jgi:hypothetical protein